MRYTYRRLKKLASAAVRGGLWAEVPMLAHLLPLSSIDVALALIFHGDGWYEGVFRLRSGRYAAVFGELGGNPRVDIRDSVEALEGCLPEESRRRVGLWVSESDPPTASPPPAPGTPPARTT